MDDNRILGIFGYWVLTIIPAYFIARKAGFSPWWCLITIFPPTALIGLWVLAFAKWPALAERSDAHR